MTFAFACPRAVLPALLAASLGATLGAPLDAQVSADFVRAVPCPNGGFQPRATTDATDAVHLLYLAGEPASADLFYVHSEDVGATFSAPLRVNGTAGTVDGSTSFRGAGFARGEDGTIHVVWLANERGGSDPGRRPVLYARLRPGAAAFEPEQGVARQRFGMDGTPAIAVRGSKVLAFWHAPGDELMPLPEKKPARKKGAAEPEDEEETAPAEGEVPQVPLRRVWMAVSDDGGASFAEERAIDARSDGATSGCGMAAAFDADGKLFLLYRTHLHRDRNTRFLFSGDGGETFEPRMVEPTRSLKELQTGSALILGPRGLLAAWEAKGLVAWAKVRTDTDRIKEPMSPKDSEGWASRPALAENAEAGLLLAWFEGTAQRPERLAWQAFAAVERRKVTSGKVEGVNVVSAPAVIVRPDEGFLVFY